MEKRIEKIESDIASIKENHLAHIEIDLAGLKVDMSWLKRNHFIVVTATVGALIVAIINLIK